MTSKPPKVDYQKLDPARLRNLRKRYQEQGHRDLADLVTLELTRRGKARGEDFSSLRWNQTSVREALDRFKKVATFHGNLRTSYTEAGGSKIGKKRDDPDWMWIDTYCGMKSQSANYVFVCYVKRPGDDPEFRIVNDGLVTSTFNADQLDIAFEAWQRLREQAA